MHSGALVIVANIQVVLRAELGDFVNIATGGSVQDIRNKLAAGLLQRRVSSSMAVQWHQSRQMQSWQLESDALTRHETIVRDSGQIGGARR